MITCVAQRAWAPVRFRRETAQARCGVSITRLQTSFVDSDGNTRETRIADARHPEKGLLVGLLTDPHSNWSLTPVVRSGRRQPGGSPAERSGAKWGPVRRYGARMGDSGG